MAKKKIINIDRPDHIFDEAYEETVKAHGSDLEINEDKEEDNA